MTEGESLPGAVTGTVSVEGDVAKEAYFKGVGHLADAEALTKKVLLGVASVACSVACFYGCLCCLLLWLPLFFPPPPLLLAFRSCLFAVLYLTVCVCVCVCS